MLTIGPISPQGLGYYDQVDSPETSQEISYYEEGAERRGQWFGRGCQALGLSGEVHSAAFRNVFQGFSPTRTVALVQNAGRTEGQRARRPGFDFTFSAPKEFSLLYAATTSEFERARLLHCHDDAVGFVLDILEDDLAKVRLGKAGKRVVAANGLVGAGFLHFSSRENDPQLHTHATVANLAQGPDGRWRALASTLAFKPGFMKTYGTLYREVLASNLEKEFGLEVGIAFGYVRIRGIPAETKAYYSKRRAQIEAVGYRDAREAGHVALQTRQKKDVSITHGSLSTTWREELARVFGKNFTVRKLVENQRQPVHRRVAPHSSLDADELATAESSPRQFPGGSREKPTPARPESSPDPREHKNIRERAAPGPLRALLEAARTPRPSPVTVSLETLFRRLTPRERFRIRHVAGTRDDKSLGQVTPRELEALSAIYRSSGMRLLALTRSSKDASALVRSGTRSMAAIALLRIACSSTLDRAIYNTSPKALIRALKRGASDIAPSLLGRRRNLFHHRRPLLDAKTVLVVDDRALSASELQRLRGLAEDAGSRVLLGKLPKANQNQHQPLDLSPRHGSALRRETEPPHTHPQSLPH